MASYVKFELKDGTIVYIESAESPKVSSGLLPRSGEQAAEPAVVPFEKAVDGIRKMAAAMAENLRGEAGEEPAEISVSFGLRASADLGNLVVSRGGLEANYNVSIRWRKDQETDAKEDKKEGKAE
jgi:hypothetical protein